MKSLLIGLAVVLMSVGVLIALPFQNKNTISWDAVTQNEDDTPATDLAGYKVYFSQVSGTYTDTDSRDVGNILSAHIPTVIGNIKGHWCYVVTSYDIAGNESDFSNETCQDRVIKKKAPVNVGVQ